MALADAETKEPDEAALRVGAGGMALVVAEGVLGRPNDVEFASSVDSGAAGRTPFARGATVPLLCGADAAAELLAGPALRRAAGLSGFDQALTAGSGAGTTSRRPSFTPPFCLAVTVCQPSCKGHKGVNDKLCASGI